MQLSAEEILHNAFLSTRDYRGLDACVPYLLEDAERYLKGEKIDTCGVGRFASLFFQRPAYLDNAVMASSSHTCARQAGIFWSEPGQPDCGDFDDGAAADQSDSLLDPEERWQSASDLASELQWIASGSQSASSAVIPAAVKAFARHFFTTRSNAGGVTVSLHNESAYSQW